MVHVVLIRGTSKTKIHAVEPALFDALATMTYHNTMWGLGAGSGFS